VPQRDIDAIVAGHVCLDIIPRFPGAKVPLEEVFKPGRLINVKEATLSTGGAVSNTGIPLAKLGVKTTLMARIGSDEFGQLTRARLARSASVEGIVESPGAHSSYTLVIAPPGIDRIFFHSPGANDAFGPEDVNATLCARARLFHFGYPPLMRRMHADGGRELVEVFRKAKGAGATTSLDMALPDPSSEAGRLDWRPLLKRLMLHVDIFQPSAEEALYMADRDAYRRLKAKAGGGDIVELMNGEEHSALAAQFIQWGAAIVTLKSGHRGFYARTAAQERFEKMGAARPGDPARPGDSARPGEADAWANREIWAPALRPPEGGSATGAGDCSLAGFLAAFLRGETLEGAVACAIAVAWQNLHALDAVSGVRDWPETQRIATDRSLPQIPFTLPSPPWRFDYEQRLWRGSYAPIAA